VDRLDRPPSPPQAGRPSGFGSPRELRQNPTLRTGDTSAERARSSGIRTRPYRAFLPSQPGSASPCRPRHSYLVGRAAYPRLADRRARDPRDRLSPAAEARRPPTAPGARSLLARSPGSVAHHPRRDRRPPGHSMYSIP
jgi:hypothetical protein